MMSSNAATAEAGGYPEQTDSWWIARWSGWLATIGAITLAIVGGLGTIFNILFLSPINALGSAAQLFAAAVILSIEGSSAVAFLSFAKPIGIFFEGKPIYVRILLYGLLTVIPAMFGLSGLGYLGFLISAGITAIYAVILIGRKGSIDDMKVAASKGGDVPQI